MRTTHIASASRRLLGAALLAGAAACSTDKLLTVENPGIAQPTTVSGAQGLPAYYAAAIGDFQVGYSGNGAFEGLINYGGLLSDEWGSSDTFPTRNETDRRSTQFDNANNADVFRAIQRSRSTAELAAAQYAQLSPDAAERSEMLSLAGYAYVLIGENYCSGVPFSSSNANGDPVYGQPLSSDQIFQLAQLKFDTAITIATAAKNDSLLYLAQVGRARALLDRNQAQDAAAEVANVPSSFSYVIFASANTDRQNNGVWSFDNNQLRLTAVDQEGTNGLPYLTDQDPRVPTLNPKRNGFDRTRPIIWQQKYPDRTSPIPVATGTEARLIEAEAAFASGATANFLTALQAARTSLGDTRTVTDPGTDSARAALLFKERAYSLWLTAHRLGDMRRELKYYSQYFGTAANVFPVGDYSGGSTYGTDVNLPIPIQEQNNPNYTGSCNKAQP